MPAVHRDAEQRAGFPFERDPLPRVVPHRGRAAAIEDEDHLLEQMARRGETLAGRDLADIAIVRGARSLMIDEHGIATTPRPGFELDRAQARNVMRADDVEPLAAHEAQIGRVLLGGELLRQLVGNDCVFGHKSLRVILTHQPLRRHARACRGHPRLPRALSLKSWMAGTLARLRASSTRYARP